MDRKESAVRPYNINITNGYVTGKEMAPVKAEVGLVPKKNLVNERERGDEQEYIPEDNADMRMLLTYTDIKHKDTLLARLNTLRRNRSLCDVVVLVENREIYGHRCVLAAFSPMLCELLTRKNSMKEQLNQQENGHTNGFANGHTNGHSNMESLVSELETMGYGFGDGRNDRTNFSDRPTYLEFPQLNYECFDALINYAYTSCLEIEAHQVKELYKTACYLKAQQCAAVCADYLINTINPYNAVGIRKCANRTNDSLLATRADKYIQENFLDITMKSKEFASLPCCQVEIIGPTDAILRAQYMRLKDDCHVLGEKVISYMQKMDIPSHIDVRPEYLTQHPHLLYVDEEFCFQDCCDTDDSNVNCYDIVQDYRKKDCRGVVYNKGNIAAQNAKTRSNSGSSGSDFNSVTSPARMATLGRYSSTESMASSVCSSCDVDDIQWKLITITRSNATDKIWLALAVVHRYMMALSIQMIDKPQCRGIDEDPKTITPRDAEMDMDAMESDVCNMIHLDSPKFGVPLAQMKVPRCACGSVNLDGQLVVFGGYDRGEVLRSAAVYDPSDNTWTDLPAMKEARGRLDATVCDGKIYAIGGSDGNHDLKSAEVYDPANKAWENIAGMLLARSNGGCASINGEVYCIGGWNGRTAIKTCEAFNPADNQWRPTPPLNEGRYQSGCVSLNGKIIVIGGCGAWSCLATVECYDPDTQTWKNMPPLTTPRRGCGAAVHKDKLYVMGGSDGQSSLSSTEIYDFAEGAWTPGPPMAVPRANVRAVSIGDKLYAVGGFSGKTFLNTIECLNQEGSKWLTSVVA